MKKIFLTLLFLFVPTYVFAQGCPTISLPTVVMNPTIVEIDSPEHNLLLADGSPAVTGYKLGWFAEGAAAPTSNVDLAKNTFTLVTGTSTCYRAPLPPFTGVPIGPTKFIAVVKAVRGTQESDWSGQSNFFGIAGNPTKISVIFLIKL